MALSESGDFQMVDTMAGPGIKDDYSRMRSEPFTFFVAPYGWIDQRLGISTLNQEDYLTERRKYVADGCKLKTLILEYHGAKEVVRKPTWASGSSREDTSWVYNGINDNSR
jgi:hypothetical protein